MRALLELAVLLVGCTALYLAGSGDIPFYTKGEAREALVVREVLRTGKWIVPRRPSGQLTRKPPLYYWSAAAATAARPESAERAARLPSVAGGVAGVVATWGTARLAFGAAAGLPSALVLATSLEWVQHATRARIDMTLAGPLAVLLFAWVRLTLRLSFPCSLIAVVAATAGTLAKGPVAIVLPALAAGVAWLPNLRSFGLVRFVGPLVFAALLAGLWYAVAYLDQGKAFLDVVITENWGRYVDAGAPDIGHRHGIAYLLGVGLLGLLPWAPLLPLAGTALREWRRPPVTMLAAWAVVVVAFFAAASGKRDAYLLPMFPAVAVLLGASLTMPAGPVVTRVVRALAALYFPGLVLLALAFALYGSGIDPAIVVEHWLTPNDAAMSTALAESGRQNPITLLALAVACVALAFVVERQRRREDWRRLALSLGVLFAAGIGVFQTTLHPALARQQSVADFLHAIGRHIAAEDAVYAFEPIDQQIRFYGPPQLARFPASGLDHPGLVLAWDREIEARRDADGNQLDVLARGGAAHGHRGRLVLARVPPGPLERLARRPRDQNG